MRCGESHDCVFNTDAERVNKVIGLMTRNLEDFGAYDRPRKQSHPLDPERGTFYPCAAVDEELEQKGHGFCRLFYKES